MISRLDYYDLEQCIKENILIRATVKEIRKSINEMIKDNFENVESKVRSIDNNMCWIVEALSVNEKDIEELKSKNQATYNSFSKELEQIKQENKMLKARLGL